MEKQFDLKQHPATKDFLILDENGETAASSYKDSLLVKFKLSDIGIDDVGQIAKENIDVYCSEDNRELSGFINGYNKAKQKYKYTEQDMINAMEYASSQFYVHNNPHEGYKSYIEDLNQSPTKVWLEGEWELGNEEDENQKLIPVFKIQVDENNYVKILRYE